MDIRTEKQRFESAYQEHADAIFRYCLHRVSDREAALDLVQDVFMRFWDALLGRRGTFSAKEVGNDRAFLFKIAHNAVIDIYRKRRTVSLEAIVEESGTEIDMFYYEVMGEGSVSHIEIEAEGKRLVEEINALDPLYRVPLYLRFVEEMKPQEIAEILDRPVNAVSVQIHRGLKQLRGRLGYEEEEKDMNHE